MNRRHSREILNEQHLVIIDCITNYVELRVMRAKAEVKQNEGNEEEILKWRKFRIKTEKFVFRNFR